MTHFLVFYLFIFIIAMLDSFVMFSHQCFAFQKFKIFAFVSKLTSVQPDKYKTINGPAEKDQCYGVCSTTSKHGLQVVLFKTTTMGELKKGTYTGSDIFQDIKVGAALFGPGGGQ